MLDLTLISHSHLRYQDNTPILGVQYCKRAIIAKNQDFSNLFGLKTSPKNGYLVRMINMDTGQEQMQPKPMEMIADYGDSILLRGVSFNILGMNSPIDYKNYGLELVLKNRRVVKCILHLYDRNTRIEYSDVE